MTGAVRAQVLRRQGPVDGTSLSAEAIIPEDPGPGEVRLAVRACGVCHTDLHIVEGDLPAHRLPLIPGHQIVGMVEAVGPGVDRPAVGERVGVGWLAGTCGRCDFCTQGLENLCPQARFTGYDRDGGYAERTIVPAAYAFPLPPRFSDAQAAPLLCAGIIGYRSLGQAGAAQARRLALYGFGGSAHLALQVAVHQGKEVAVVTRGEAHRRIARELGAAWVGGPGDPPPWAPDAAVVFAPSGQVVREALGAVRAGGTVAINAIHLDGLPEMPYRLLYQERTLKSVTNYTRDDARAFLRLAESIPVQVEVETFPLESASDVLLRLKRRQLKVAGVLRAAVDP
jgi:propanol-preferring alcohol dehydrogenase